jgi:hypothetical protein
MSQTCRLVQDLHSRLSKRNRARIGKRVDELEGVEKRVLLSGSKGAREAERESQNFEIRFSGANPHLLNGLRSCVSFRFLACPCR